MNIFDNFNQSMKVATEPFLLLLGSDQRKIDNWNDALSISRLRVTVWYLTGLILESENSALYSWKILVIMGSDFVQNITVLFTSVKLLPFIRRRRAVREG